MEKNKVVLYLGGGAMSGVFGAGVVTGLEQQNFYSKIKAVYAVSAGGFNAAYFLAHQSKLGSSIYFQDIIKGFIFPKKIIPGALQRLHHGYVKKTLPQNIINAMDVDHILKIVTSKKPLNISKIVQGKI